MINTILQFCIAEIKIKYSYERRPDIIIDMITSYGILILFKRCESGLINITGFHTYMVK